MSGRRWRCGILDCQFYRKIGNLKVESTRFRLQAVPCRGPLSVMDGWMLTVRTEHVPESTLASSNSSESLRFGSSTLAGGLLWTCACLY